MDNLDEYYRQVAIAGRQREALVCAALAHRIIRLVPQTAKHLSIYPEDRLVRLVIFDGVERTAWIIMNGIYLLPNGILVRNISHTGTPVRTIPYYPEYVCPDENHTSHQYIGREMIQALSRLLTQPPIKRVSWWRRFDR